MMIRGTDHRREDLRTVVDKGAGDETMGVVETTKIDVAKMNTEEQTKDNSGERRKIMRKGETNDSNKPEKKGESLIENRDATEEVKLVVM